MKGDREALGRVIERLAPFLLIQAEYRLGRFLPAYGPEDLVQETFDELLAKLPNLDFTGSKPLRQMLAYLTQVVRLKANNALRKEGRRQYRRVADPSSSQPDPMDRIQGCVTDAVERTLKSERAATLRAAIEELPELDQAIVILRGMEGYSCEAVGRMLGMKPNTVAQRYRRAILKLRERLSDEFLEGLADEEE